MSAPLRRTLRLFGARVAVEADDARVPAAASAALARYGWTGDVTTGFRVQARTLPGSAESAWPRTSTIRTGPRVRFNCGRSWFEADPGTGSAELWLGEEVLAEPDAVRLALEGAVWSLLVGGGLVHPVHAGLVTGHGRAVLLRGASGAGKSTTTYACVRRGLRMVSDDFVYGAALGPPDVLWGYPWRMFLVPDAAARFPELAGVEVVAHPGSDRWKVPVEPAPARRRRSARVDAIVFLDAGPELRLEQLTTDEATARFWASALPSARQDIPEPFLRHLLARPSYVLSRGTDPDATAGVVDQLLRDLAATS